MNVIEQNDPKGQGTGGDSVKGARMRQPRSRTTKQAPARAEAGPTSEAATLAKLSASERSEAKPSNRAAEVSTSAEPQRDDKIVEKATAVSVPESPEQPLREAHLAGKVAAIGRMQRMRRAITALLDRPGEAAVGAVDTPGADDPIRQELRNPDSRVPLTSVKESPDSGEGFHQRTKVPGDTRTGPEPKPSEHPAPFVIPEKLRQRFHVSDDKYYFRDQKQTLAFEDKGQKITTGHEQTVVVQSMVELAVAKGWQGIKVRGTAAFKREAWLAASQRGLETTGYRPKAVDREHLQARMEERTRAAPAKEPLPNSMERAQAELPTAAPTSAANDGDSATASANRPKRLPLSKGQQKAVDALREVLAKRGDSPQSVELTAALAADELQDRRSHVGKLLAHGHAPYKHDPDEQESYYVVLDTSRGAKTLWGVDLGKQLAHSPVTVGTDIVVSQVGQNAVTAWTTERDANQKPTGRIVPIEAIRNQWEITTVDEMRTRAMREDRTAPVQPPDTKPMTNRTSPSMKVELNQQQRDQPVREMHTPDR